MTITPEKKSVLGYDVSELAITEIILRDFDNSWEYYKFNLEERRDIISRIYSFIGIPLAVSSIFFYLIDNGLLQIKGTEISDHYGILFAISLAMFVYGELQVIALALESGVSRDYLNFLNNVRNYAGVHSSELQPFLKFNKYEKGLAAFLKQRKDGGIQEYKDFLGSADWVRSQADPPPPKNVVEGIEKLVRDLKSSYWRASSAIFVVSLCFTLLVLSIVLWRRDSVGEIELVMIGIFATIVAFFVNTYIFRRLAFGALLPRKPAKASAAA
ncbi:hypothetical protein J2045_002154 [Peteryoungia aggregata LMG 23059]|uniref:Uncharacterized protein n=1 Tax=Peteryoungia aggregata LMG 23059 TaxID=1368425 RepID=A0ABU0G701_9HYPH|nr:hypothetical protein [Peteryoungia aggregata]MDQ0421127.1 hypothetical protein [Peteryoungia aggregata LMG 23059]